MNNYQDDLATVLRAALRNPRAVPQAELARAFYGSCAIPAGRRLIPNRQPRSIGALQPVRIAG